MVRCTNPEELPSSRRCTGPVVTGTPGYGVGVSEDRRVGETSVLWKYPEETHEPQLLGRVLQQEKSFPFVLGVIEEPQPQLQIVPEVVRPEGAQPPAVEHVLLQTSVPVPTSMSSRGRREPGGSGLPHQRRRRLGFGDEV